MPTPVKTTALAIVTQAVSAITGIGQAFLNPPNALDREVATFPVVFVFDLPETLTRVNRYGYGQVPMVFEVWIEADKEDQDAKMDLWGATVADTLATDPGILSAGRRMEPTPGENVRKHYADDRTCVVELHWTLHYRFAWGDSFDPAE